MIVEKLLEFVKKILHIPRKINNLAISVCIFLTCKFVIVHVLALICLLSIFTKDFASETIRAIDSNYLKEDVYRAMASLIRLVLVLSVVNIQTISHKLSVPFGIKSKFNDLQIKRSDLKMMILCSIAVLTEVIKIFIQKERPNSLDLKSFPSGHASVAAAIVSFAFCDNIILGAKQKIHQSISKKLNMKTKFKIGFFPKLKILVSFALGLLSCFLIYQANYHYAEDIIISYIFFLYFACYYYIKFFVASKI